MTLKNSIVCRGYTIFCNIVHCIIPVTPSNPFTKVCKDNACLSRLCLFYELRGLKEMRFQSIVYAC